MDNSVLSGVISRLSVCIRAVEWRKMCDLCLRSKICLYTKATQVRVHTAVDSMVMSHSNKECVCVYDYVLYESMCANSMKERSELC